MWSGRDGEAEEAAEGGLGRAAAIEAEDELVEPRVRPGLFGSGAEAFVRLGFEVGGSRRRVRR
jgi:hypothetical protein